MPRSAGSPWILVFSAACGGLVGAGLMGGVAFMHGTDIGLGVVAGGLLLGALWYGVAAGTMSPVTLFSIILALFGCMIGPGCDDYMGLVGILGAMSGGFLGLLLFGTRRRHPDGKPCDRFGEELP